MIHRLFWDGTGDGSEAVPEQLRAAIVATLQMLRAGGYVDDFRVSVLPLQDGAAQVLPAEWACQQW